ncbi:MAG: transposase [Treponema sp.]|nr:transposase [Treponema sp.]
MLEEPLPAKPGHTEKADTEYRRNRTCGVFMGTEPLALWRYAEASAQQTKKDWARKIQWLLDTRYPAAKRVVLVMDNLNTHTLSRCIVVPLKNN